MILLGDCKETLRSITTPVQMVVTSPPYYGVKDYGHEAQLGTERTPDEYVANLVAVFEEVRKVLADDGVVFLNLGDNYYNYRPGKAQTIPKQSVAKTNADFQSVCHRRGLQLEGLKEKDLIGIPWKTAFALRDAGWYLRQDIIWSRPNPMPEGNAKDRCTKSHEYVFLLAKNQSYSFDSDAIKESAIEASFKQRRSVWESDLLQWITEQPEWDSLRERYSDRESVWRINPSRYRGAHFATFPEELAERCILAGSREGDTVLDPFLGSGTTAAVSVRLGRQYIGCELNEAYVKLAEDRVREARNAIEFSLF